MPRYFSYASNWDNKTVQQKKIQIHGFSIFHVAYIGKKEHACIKDAYCRRSYVETKRYLSGFVGRVADGSERKQNSSTRRREEVAAQLHDPHSRYASHTRGALYYLLNIYLPTYGLSILFFFF